MAEFTWPNSVPGPLVVGYSRGGGDDGVIRSNVGRVTKLRPRFTSPPPEPVNATFFCNLAQLQTLLDFYNVTLQRVLPFNMRDGTKPGLATVEYRFTARPSYSPVDTGALYLVTVELEQLATYQGSFDISDELGNGLTDSSEGLTT